MLGGLADTPDGWHGDMARSLASRLAPPMHWRLLSALAASPHRPKSAWLASGHSPHSGVIIACGGSAHPLEAFQSERPCWQPVPSLTNPARHPSSPGARSSLMGPKAC